jgi:UPF0755 protein
MADRTEAEREAARLERERRRAEREGTDAPTAPEPLARDDEPPVHDDEPLVDDDEPPVYDDKRPVYDDEPAVYDDEPAVHHDEPAGAPEPLIPPDLTGSSSSTDDFEVFASRTRRAADAGVIVDHAGDAFDDHDGDVFDDHDGDVFDDHDGDVFDDHDHGDHENGDDGAHPDELPAGTRRISALQRKPAKRQPVRRNKARGMGRRHSLRGRIGGLLALVVGLGLIWFLVQLFQPFHGDGHGHVTVTIPAHASSGQIGDLLEREGVISSSFFFGLRATLSGDRGDLRSGTYQLQRDMSYSKVLSILTKAPPAAKVTNLTLIEGRTRAEIGNLLRSQGVRGSYIAATRHSRLLDPRRYAAPRSTPSLEGFLFPSTYQLREPISVNALVSDQLKQFRKVFSGVNLNGAKRRHLTPYDVLIIASMVEAEASTERDRRNVASVIANRLARGMPLQIDATTRYATGNYTKPLTVSQLNSRSPYNTRLRPGLPPTPIDNPGLAAIEAAANPPRTNFLYFVVKPCGNGAMTFTGDYQQFLRDAARYQAARAKRGGRSPEHC